ncbi:MAG TPA: hypothetical protein VL947_09325, partial [Cytophagales bacterium]|nr:hypothetical protein [Cytophagales bacterium]
VYTLGLLMVMTTLANGQANFNFIERNTWDGPYDIKMIAAPNLEAVYVDPAEAANKRLKRDSIIRHETILMSGGTMDVNNDYKEGNPFQTVDVPLPALLCSSPGAPCYSGLKSETLGGSCMTYNYDESPLSVSRMIAMSYADYDNDMSTFSSSMAKLDISSCSEIEAAFLYWTGNFRSSSAPNITLSTPTQSYNQSGNVFDIANDASIRTVKFKRPGGAYIDVTANAAVPTVGPVNTGTRTHQRGYLCVANVTSLVQGTGGGEFWVGNIRSYPHEDDGGSTSGWTLVVVFRSPLSPPRLISLWDGFKAIPKGTTESFTLTGLAAPAIANFKSYVGFAALDGENFATELIGKTPEGLVFSTNNGGTPVSINPNCDGSQPKYKLWNEEGVPAKASGAKNQDACKRPLFDASWASVCDGISSSKITSYNEITNTNGNEIVRLPANKNTLGFDVHHLRLPSNAVAPGATTATLTVSAGPQGGTTPFLAYVAIERLQPKLELSKFADVNVTNTNSEITYSFKVKNKGNDISLGNDLIRDTLDLATSYVAGSLSVQPLSAVTLTSTGTAPDGRQVVQLAVPKKISAGDSVTFQFKVKVKDYVSNINLWDVQCKRTITNTAWVEYNTLTSGILTSRSNGNDCGIGSETRVLIQDSLFGKSMVKDSVGPINICPHMMDNVLEHIRTTLVSSGKITAAQISLYDIRDSAYVRVAATDTFANGFTSIYYALRDHATGTSCQEIYKVKFTSCTLPLFFVSFNAVAGTEMQLYWRIASMKNKGYFAVE